MTKVMFARGDDKCIEQETVLRKLLITIQCRCWQLCDTRLDLILGEYQTFFGGSYEITDGMRSSTIFREL